MMGGGGGGGRGNETLGKLDDEDTKNRASKEERQIAERETRAKKSAGVGFASGK